MDTLTQLQNLEGQHITLHPAGHLDMLSSESADIAGVQAVVLAQNRDSLMVEIARGHHQGRRFVIGNGRYDIEIDSP